jgi:hypothetical protein
MTVNAAGLSNDSPGRGACTYGPGVSVLVDAESGARGAIEVVSGVGVESGKTFGSGPLVFRLVFRLVFIEAGQR